MNIFKNIIRTVDIPDWDEKLAGFPMWCFGGTSFSIDENGTSDEGTIYFYYTGKTRRCQR